MNNISNFAGESIQNKILLVPAVAIGAFIGSRAVASVLAVGLKSAGYAVNLIGVNTIGENLHTTGDQLINFATRRFRMELKIGMNLCTAAVVGVGVATILSPAPPEVLFLEKITHQAFQITTFPYRALEQIITFPIRTLDKVLAGIFMK